MKRLMLSPPLFFFLGSFLLPDARASESVQHWISRRSLSPILDTCALLKTPLSDILSSISTLQPSVETIEDEVVEACLCTSAIRTFLESTGITDVDVEALERATEAYIAESPGAQRCVYPPHATQSCSRDNPCGFDCADGFQLSSFEVQGKTTMTCTCPPPNTICDGQCGSFPDGCPTKIDKPNDDFRPYRDPSFARPSPSLRPSPSARPSPPSEAFQSHVPTPTGSFSNAQAQQAQDAGCAPYETLCGVYAPRGRRTTECVDTQSSLESCGGCTVSPPSPFLGYDYDYEHAKRDTATGVDCSALEGVADVSCFAGSCLVQACEIGWKVAPSGDHCILDESGDDTARERPADDAFSENYVPAKMPLLQPPPSSITTSSMSSETSDSIPSPSSSATSSPPSSDPEPPSSASESPTQSSESAADSDVDQESDPDSASIPPSKSDSDLDNSGGQPSGDFAAEAPSYGDDSGNSGPTRAAPGDAVDVSAGPGPGGGHLTVGIFAADAPDDDTNSMCGEDPSAPGVGVNICLGWAADGGMGIDDIPGTSDTLGPTLSTATSTGNMDTGVAAGVPDSVNMSNDGSSIDGFGRFSAGHPEEDGPECGDGSTALDINVCAAVLVDSGVDVGPSGVLNPTLSAVDSNVPSIAGSDPGAVADALNAVGSDGSSVGGDLGFGRFAAALPSNGNTDDSACGDEPSALGVNVCSDQTYEASLGIGSTPDGPVLDGPEEVAADAPGTNIPTVDLPDTYSDIEDAVGTGTDAGTDAGVSSGALDSVGLSGFNVSPPSTSDPDVQDTVDVNLPTDSSTGSPTLPTDSLPGQAIGTAEAVDSVASQQASGAALSSESAASAAEAAATETSGYVADVGLDAPTDAAEAVDDDTKIL